MIIVERHNRGGDSDSELSFNSVIEKVIESLPKEPYDPAKFTDSDRCQICFEEY